MEALLGTLVGGLITILVTLIGQRAQHRVRELERDADLERLRLELQWKDAVSCRERRREAARRLIPVVVDLHLEGKMWMEVTNRLAGAKSEPDARRKEFEAMRDTQAESLAKASIKMHRLMLESLVDIGSELHSLTTRLLDDIFAVSVEFGKVTEGWPPHAVQDTWERRDRAATSLRDTVVEYRDAVIALAEPVALARPTTAPAAS